jgi:uroporphyrinogen III methyltransferase/synthase
MSALRGERIVVTRAEEQAGELVDLLERRGASVIRCPTIRIAPPPSFDTLDHALTRLEEYRWIVLTSSNGVRAVASRLEALGRGTESLDPERVAAVGSSTAHALESLGVRAAFVPDVERSRGLTEELRPIEGERILLTRADIADPGLAKTLLARGAGRVDDVVAYRTELLAPDAEALRELRLGVRGITFTSPSTLRGFVALGPEWRSLLGGVVIAVLGPATSEAAAREGLEVDAEAAERSMTGLVEALEWAFVARAGSPGEETAE